VYRQFLLAVFVCLAPTYAQTTLLDILKEELARNFDGLKKADPAPYFIGYSVVEQQAEILSATRGVLQTRSKGHSRVLDVTVRVGSPKLDNYHIQGGESPQFTSATLLTLEDNPNAIKRRIWLETDRVYKAASQRLINLKTSTKVNVEAADKSDDFSTEQASTYTEPVKKLSPIAEEWAVRARRWSGQLAKHEGVLASSVSLIFQRETKYLVTTEGTRVQHGRGFVRVLISAQGKASDGMDLSTFDSFEAEEVDGLPKEADITAAVNKVGSDLTKLLDAPVVDPFVGPAILSGKASGVFFHEIFGHRIEGHRQRDESDGQTFTKAVNSRILPEFISVVFDPTLKRLGNVDLNGYYQYDDEGVKARKVALVEQGTLKTFLMSRSPIDGFPNSNGHGRRQAGAEIVSRQSNLLVESSKKVADPGLRNLLIEEIKKQGKPYGFFFQNITGGFTFTGRRGLQAFKVLPLVVYRVYADGRPDELVRGVDIVGTPLASFARILATSDKVEVFNGYCGAESGSVPVSAASPAILVSELEIQKKEKGKDRPPLLTPPMVSGGLQ
jgi:TldD protein